MGAPTWTKFLFLPMVMLLGQVDFKDEKILMYSRIAFYTAVVLTLGVNAIVKGIVTKKADRTRIWVPPPPAGFMAPSTPAPAKETTYMDHELGLCSSGINQAMVMAAVMTFFSFKMGMHLPVAMQAVMLPVNLFTNGAVQRHLLGMNVEKPYDESLEPPAATPATDASTSGTGTGTGAGGAGSGSAFDAAADAVDPDSATGKLLAYAMGQWDEHQSLDLTKIIAYLDEGANINAQTPADGWTVLMMAAGDPSLSKDTINSLLTNGSSLMTVDNDSETPLHWAARKGSLNAVNAMLEMSSGAERRHLLSHKSADGQTALEVAKAGDNAEVTAAIEKVAAATAEVEGEADAAAPAAAPKAAEEPTAAVAASDDVEDVD